MEFLKSILKPETYTALESELEEYSKDHEKVRLVNVSSGDYVSKKKLDKAESEKSQLQAEIDSLKTSLSDKDATTDATVQKLKDQIAEFAKQNAEREAAQRMSERFNAVKGNSEFVNSFTENGVKEAFVAALKDSMNQGKSDAEIYASVVQPLGAVYKNPYKPNDIPPMGNIDPILEADKFKGMSLDEQMKFANTHSEQYHKLFKE